MLRVLVQPRADFYELHGGDSIQLAKTVEHLRHLDVIAEISVEPAPELSQYDLVHIFNFGVGGGDLRYLINARRQNKPVVVSPIYWNTTRFDRAKSELLQAWFPPASPLSEQVASQRRESERLARMILVRAADRVFALSLAEAEWLVRDFGIERERVRVIYNGIEPEFAEARPDGFVQEFGLQDFVLCVARLNPRKNQLTLVQAWRDEPVPLVLIGAEEDANYAAECKRQAGRNTHFLSHLPRARVAEAYAPAKVHALVSWHEMMPLAALEAGLAGCNLVLTTETAGPEFFGEMAWYVEPDDPSAIRAAIHAALDAPRRPELAAHIREQFTWEQTAAQTAAAYREAIEHHPKDTGESSTTEYLRLLEDLSTTLEQVAVSSSTLAENLWQENLKLTEFIRRLERVPGARALRLARHLFHR